MVRRLLFLVMLMPFLELYVIIQVHRHWASVWGRSEAWLITLASIFLAALIGVALAKKQGLRLISAAQDQLRQGTVPSQTMLEGLLLLAGAILLVLPGYISDALGTFLVLPWTRRLGVKSLGRWWGEKARSGSIRVYPSRPYHASDSLIDDGRIEVIDVETVQKP